MSIKERAIKRAEQLTMIIEAKIEKKLFKIQSDLWKEHYKLLAEDFHALNIEFNESVFKKAAKDKEEEKKEEERQDYYCTFPPKNKNGDFRYTHHRETGKIYLDKYNNETSSYERFRKEPFLNTMIVSNFINNSNNFKKENKRSKNDK